MRHRSAFRIGGGGKFVGVESVAQVDIRALADKRKLSIRLRRSCRCRTALFWHSCYSVFNTPSDQAGSVGSRTTDNGDVASRAIVARQTAAPLDQTPADRSPTRRSASRLRRDVRQRAAPDRERRGRLRRLVEHRPGGGHRVAVFVHIGEWPDEISGRFGSRLVVSTR